jgi:acetylornithine deacetylase/succinyl-diaminopimelate desuccinylase-like protein
MGSRKTMGSPIFEDLTWLIKERSVYREEPLQLKLARRLKGLGFHVQLQYVAPGRPNLIAVRGANPRLLILTHADTFPAYQHDNPWELSVDDRGLLRGRGVLDAKGQIAAALEAFRLTAAPVAFSTVVDEEVDGCGSLRLDIPKHVEAAVVLEPTNLRPATAQAGFLEVDIEIPGRPAHGSVPRDEDNAIIRSMTLFQALKALPFARHYHPLLGFSKMNLEMIQGGGQRVIVPHFCRMRVDVQIPPGLTSFDTERQICLAVKAFGGRLKVVDRAEPFETPPDSPVYQLLAQAIGETLGQSVRPTGMPSWTDAANLVSKGVSCVVFGAGDLSLAHTGDEAVALADLQALASVLARLFQLWNRPTP